MQRPGLFLFHITMCGIYAFIIWTCESGWTQLGFAVWLVALVACLAIVVGCNVLTFLYVVRSWQVVEPEVEECVEEIEEDLLVEV